MAKYSTTVSVMREAYNLFALVPVLLAGIFMAPATAVAEGELTGAAHDVSIDEVQPQPARDDLPEASSPTNTVADPFLDERRCPNVVLLDSENLCRYAAPGAAVRRHAL